MMGRSVAYLLALALLAEGVGTGLAWAQIPKPIPKPIPRPLPRPAPASAAPKPIPRPTVPTPVKRSRPVKPAGPVLPAPILAYLTEACETAGGRLTDGLGSVLAADFNGDGRADYVIEGSRIRCAPAPPAHASGLSSVALFVSVGDQVQKVVTGMAFEARIDRGQGAPALVLDAKGADCGHAPPEQRCRNRLAWNAQQRRFTYVERVFLNSAGQVIDGPAWPAIDADIPSDFITGSFTFAKKGPKGTGCNVFYNKAGTPAAMAQAYRNGDWNGLTRTVIGLNCNSDLAWFFLGSAAENFGRPEAAKIYYAAAIARHQKATQAFANLYATCLDASKGAGCMGVEVIAMSQKALARLP